MRRKIVLLAASAALGACAQETTERRESDRRALAEAPVGEPVHCLPLARIESTRVRDSGTIDFHLRGREIYRNRLRQECPGLAFENGFSYRTSTGRLCSVDLIAVNRSGAGGGPGRTACALGVFQRIDSEVR